MKKLLEFNEYIQVNEGVLDTVKDFVNTLKDKVKITYNNTIAKIDDKIFDKTAEYYEEKYLNAFSKDFLKYLAITSDTKASEGSFAKFLDEIKAKNEKINGIDKYEIYSNIVDSSNPLWKFKTFTVTTSPV